jgi:integrase
MNGAMNAFSARVARLREARRIPRRPRHGAPGAHGFRSMASTLLNEQGCWNRDAIERQLAHGERDEVRAACDYAEYLPERRRMMQAWADYLHGLHAGANVIPIKRLANFVDLARRSAVGDLNDQRNSSAY